MTNLSTFFAIPLLSFSCGLLAFVRKRKHLLNTLLRLEFIILRIFWFMSNLIVNMGGDCYFLLFFLTLAACEGALGLALLVAIVRSHGNDNFSSFRVLQC